MASSKYKAYRKILYGEDDQLSKNNKKINNYKARLESSGVNPEKVTDTRNFIEKGLNLEKDQNVLFDLFELLNRPQQALFNAWEAGQEGNDVLEGAWKGLSGQKDTEFKNILKNYGMEDRKGKLDLVDALGFAGDVFLDPMDIIPLAGFSKFGDAINAGEGVIKASKNLKTGSDLVMSGIGKGIKGAAKLTDSGIEKALTKADEVKGVTNALTGETTKLKYLNPTAKKAANLMPVSKETGELVDNVVGRLQNYKQIKNDISDMFVVPDFLKKATKTQRAEDYRKDITRIKSAKDIKEVSNIIEDFAKKNGENFDDIARDLTLFAESHMNREINNKDLLKLAKSGKLVGYDEVVETLNEIVKKSIPENILDKNPQLFTVKVNPDTMKVELGKGFNVFNEFDTSGTTILNKRYTKEQLDRIDKINKRYLSDEGYRDLFDEILGNSWRKNPSDIVDDVGRKITKNQEVWGTTDGYNLYNEGDNDLSTIYHGERSPKPQYDELNYGKNERFAGKDSRSFSATGKNSGAVATQYAQGKGAKATVENAIDKNDVSLYEIYGRTKNPLTIDANGRVWTRINYKNTDAYNAYIKISNDDRRILEDLFAQSGYDANKFGELINQDEELVKRLKDIGVDVASEDLKVNPVSSSTTYNSTSNYTKSNNIDVSNLAKMILHDGRLTDRGMEEYFLNNESTTDYIIDSINKNKSVGRSSKDYDVVAINNVLDSSYEGTDYVNLNPENLKLVDNKTPINTNSLSDYAENMKPVKNGIIDILNKEVDLGLGTDLAGKYDFLTNDNYIPHTLTGIGKEIRPDLDKIIKSNPTYGNKNLLNSRTRLGSIEEINNDVREIINSIDESKLTPKLVEFKKSNAKFMEDNFISALTNKYVDPKVSIINNASQVSKANQILVRDTFGNADEMLKLKSQIKDAYDLGDPYEVKELTKKLNQLEDGSAIKFLSPTDKRIPKGYTRLTNAEITQITEKYNVMNKQLGIDGGFGDLTKTISKFGGDVAIDNSILEMFRIGSEDKSITGLGKLYSTYINTFRKWKTASFTFLLNNLVGNSSNLMLSGIGLDEQAKYGQTVLDIITKGENLSMARIAGKQLDDAGNRIADFWELYRSLGFDTSALELNEMPKEIKELFSGERKLSGFKDYMINGIPYFNNMMNNKMDMASRLTVMLKCLDDPKYMGRIGVDNIYDAISRVMFDPKMLTSWEKKYAKNIIPFYTYAKNNLMYHAINLGNNGSKYTKLVKSMQNLQRQATNNNEENLSDFIKNSLYIPIPGYDEKGNYTILRASLPFGQFVETVNDPLGEIANMLTPAIKAPIENLLNKELYSGRDIETFKGQKSTTIPFLTKKQEKMLSDFTGLDVPVKTVSRLVQGTLDSVKEGNNIVESIGQGLKSTVAMNGNINNDKLFKSYRDIDYLEDVIRQFKQSGNTIPTIAELKRANKNKTIAGLDALFNKYGIK